MLVLGDTNSCLSVISAKRLHIPIFHMEAGNRCKDECLPEETNRRIVDIISDVNLAYSEHARRYLADCGLPKERTYVTGSPMDEVLAKNLAQIKASDIHERLDRANALSSFWFLCSRNCSEAPCKLVKNLLKCYCYKRCFRRKTMNPMQQFSNTIKILLCALLLCAFLAGTLLTGGATAKAAEPTANEQTIPDPSQTGSWTVAFTHEAGEPDKFGNKVGLYKVANLQVKDGFSLVYDELFESVGEPPRRDAQLGADLAQKLNETAEIKGISLDAPSEEIWSDGTVTFKGVDAGLYLVVQTYRVSDSEKAVIEPFLAMIPERRADGTLNYDVKISSSGASDRKAGSESQNKMLSEITPDSKLPNTGGFFWE